MVLAAVLAAGGARLAGGSGGGGGRVPVSDETTGICCAESMMFALREGEVEQKFNSEILVKLNRNLTVVELVKLRSVWFAASRRPFCFYSWTHLPSC
jgi:hypothetical protein